jgi:hypothetical protein
MGLFEEVDGFVDGAIAFGAVGANRLEGNDLRVLLGIGAGEIELGEDLLGEIRSEGGGGEKGESSCYYSKFHNYCKAGAVPGIRVGSIHAPFF